MSVLLYDHPLSPFAQKVKIALMEKGVPFEARLPDGLGAGGAEGDFALTNPRREVPALVHGDVRLFDSTIILEYIEDRWPQPALLPASPADRARVRQIEDVLDTHFEAIVWGLGELRWFKRAEGELATSLESRAADQIRGFHNWLERQLGTAEWFNGKDFGWGDIAAAPYLNGAAAQGFAPKGHPALQDWLSRVNRRPSVARANREAKDVLGAMEQVAGAVRSGTFRREYRDHRLEWMVKSGGIDVVLSGLAEDNIRFSPDFD
ncbi:glutathione S-transferase family protein [Novosphingobium sp. ZN18A2]|uniref:glutathione S-transferase family protein n=1 Tax=Novosphingobium sp. ZN18A2 TaxID=3079861 RepID=UPI0030CDCE17